MFDLGSAVVLGLVLVGLVSLARSLIYGTAQDRVIAIVSLVVAVIAVLLVAASDFAHEQVVLDRTLDSLNFWSQLVVALLAAGIASGVWQGYKTVRNIGQNEPKYPTAKLKQAQALGMPLAGTGLRGAQEQPGLTGERAYYDPGEFQHPDA